jgi:hypothetical protein
MSRPNQILAVVDLNLDLDANLVFKITRGIAGVKLDAEGWILRKNRSRRMVELDNWRPVYTRWLQRLFPQGWVYAGGRHLSVHASPPPHERGGRADNEAGRLLFAIIEAKPL